MAFVLYQNKSSLDQKNCRLVQGGTTEMDGNFLAYWEKKEILDNQLDDQIFTITADYAFRPDKISYKLYGRSDFMWIVLQYNNIVDINEELGIGVVLTVPSYGRVLYNITGNSN
jgi:hypothetical protein